MAIGSCDSMPHGGSPQSLRAVLLAESVPAHFRHFGQALCRGALLDPVHGRRLAAPLSHAWSMAKYDGLTELLRHRPGDRFRLTFEQVAASVPGGLPPSAYRYRVWWANEPKGSHVQARGWINAGWLVAEVDFSGGTVTFSRAAGQL